jgi:hypothetical protein
MLAFLVFGVLILSPWAHAQQEPAGLAAPDTAAITDAFTLPAPSQVQLGGLVGERFDRSETNRLLVVDENVLLDGFRHRPGSHPWIGEHVGKWLHAAALTYACTGNAELRAKLDRVATELMQTQEPDGYLGTYSPDKRFGLYKDADWDVWSHKYDLLGLLTYYQYTGNKAALETCKRVGDLLINTFGTDKKSILSAGTQVGMAATSVLEPVVLLYRATGDKRYLDFAEYIVTAWDEKGGPRVFSALLNGDPVYKVANGKAYEMTSNLAGLCELYRATGKKDYLTAVLNAWKDIAANRLYLTGSGSSHELWQPDFHLPGDGNAQICETCVTLTWMQLNIELLRLLGEARFAEEIEKTLYNHLLGAQKPTGDDWCYYTPMFGRKPYDSVTHCCHSSGPRGVALAPEFLYSVSKDGIAVNVYSVSTATLPFGPGEVKLEQQTGYPLDGAVKIILTPKGIAEPFTLRLRKPAWSGRVTVTVNGQEVADTAEASGYIALKRVWTIGDTVQCAIDMTPRILLGDHDNEGRMAVLYGPLVLAEDQGLNAGDGAILTNRAPACDDPAKFQIQRVEGEGLPRFETDGLLFKKAAADAPAKPEPCKLFLTPYYAAGSDASPFCVWMPRPAAFKATPVFLFTGAEETRSRVGNAGGSIADGDPDTYVVTYDGTKQAEDWYALEVTEPVVVRRVVFVQGMLFHDGGWFDASAGKPKIQVKKTKDGAWEDLGILDSYPAATATHPAGLKAGQEFEVRVAPVSVIAVRVIGKPACGDNPAQAFTSCAELHVY